MFFLRRTERNSENVNYYTYNCNRVNYNYNAQCRRIISSLQQMSFRLQLPNVNSALRWNFASVDRDKIFKYRGYAIIVSSTLLSIRMKERRYFDKSIERRV